MNQNKQDTCFRKISQEPVKQLFCGDWRKEYCKFIKTSRQMLTSLVASFQNFTSSRLPIPNQVPTFYDLVSPSCMIKKYITSPCTGTDFLLLKLSEIFKSVSILLVGGGAEDMRFQQFSQIPTLPQLQILALAGFTFVKLHHKHYCYVLHNNYQIPVLLMVCFAVEEVLVRCSLICLFLFLLPLLLESNL